MRQDVKRRLAIVLLGWIGLFAIALLFSEPADAHEWKLAELSDVNLHYKHFFPGGRDPLFIHDHPKEELDFHINTDVLRYGFVNTQLHTMTNDSQYHVVGMHLEIGVRVAPALEVFYEHFSKHVLDEPDFNNGLPRYPVEDSISLRIFFYRNPANREAVLP